MFFTDRYHLTVIGYNDITLWPFLQIDLRYQSGRPLNQI